MFLRQIHDESLAQYAYIIGCQRTGDAIVIDPERDIDRYLEIARDNDLRITAVAETHIHADFVSGSRQFLDTQSGVTAYLSDEGDADWKYEWAKGRSDVQLVKHGDQIRIGGIQITAVHTPGHTPEHISFRIEDQGGGANQPIAMATGDFVFVGDVGRPDLLESAAGHAGAMEPSARRLYQSIADFRDQPDFMQILPGHGAGSACGKALGAIPITTVGYELRFNSAIRTALDDGEDAFVREILDGQPEPPVYFARMKRVNKEGPIVLPALPNPAKLCIEDFTALTNDAKAVVLDTHRDREEFALAHLRGSLFAPLGGSGFSAVAGSYIEEDQDIYLLVSNQQMLDEAIRQLVRIGLDNIKGWAIADEVLGKTAEMTHTPHEETSKLSLAISNRPSAMVLDVRTAAEHATGNLPGSKNIAYTRLAAHLDELPLDRPIFVHCASGQRASYAAAYLERNGYDVVYFDGGIEVPASADTRAA
ncbi:MAG: hydroxyacylglutathione hydrolase [Verrucomicrobiales bacterium]|jgi:hydroxyacylglutathione hydrolase